MNVLLKLTWNCEYVLDAQDAVRVVQLLQQAQRVNTTYGEGGKQMIEILYDEKGPSFTSNVPPVLRAGDDDA